MLPNVVLDRETAEALYANSRTIRIATAGNQRVRFIIYREEFADGRRTAELRDCLFASEIESVARRKQRELFEGEVYRYRQTYWHIETEQKNEVMIGTRSGTGPVCGRRT